MTVLKFNHLGLLNRAYRQKLNNLVNKNHSLPLHYQKVYMKRTGALYKVTSLITQQNVYIKYYFYPTTKDRIKILLRGGLVGKSRARIEFNNLQYLNIKGLSPKPLFLIEDYHHFLLSTSILAIEEVENSIPLDEFIFTRLPSLSYTRRQDFIKFLAITTRKMNEDGFINGEYHWRNILLTDNGKQFTFQIIDCSRHRLAEQYFSPYLDLASLDVYAEEFFSVKERMMFLKTYLGVEKLIHQRKLVKHILEMKQKVSLKEMKRYKSAHKKFGRKKHDIKQTS